MKENRVFCMLLCVLLLTGCARGKVPEGSTDYIYYVNTEGTGLVKEEYTIEGESLKEKIENVLSDLQKETDSIDYKSAYPQNVSVKGWELNDSDLEIDFGATYKKMNTTEELLLRAATVQSLVQISGVDYVRFTIEGKPLKDADNNEIGYMSREKFVDNTGNSLHSYQDGNLRLFFANKKGDKLVEEEVSVRYNSNMSVEKLIVEQLLKGPSVDGAYPTIPPGTKILGVAVRDGICYVNFDEGFLNTAYNVTPQVTIYSVVNSIVEGGLASQVQILVNGEVNAKYHGSISLEKPFERNLEIIEKKEKD
ncbi:MAG: GerMN domain-containing protein [Lachnospiraceae bacterium]